MFRDSLLGVRAPEFPEGLTWLNSLPLRMEDLRGKVVLMDFWTYSCANCIRTLPHLKKWHERYKDLGLVIIGVHTPEFDFEKSKENVERALKDFGIEYPVILDSDYAVWHAYANNVWPRKLLVNQGGVIVYDHAGEGAYGRTEREIQTLLRENNPNVTFEQVESDEGEGGICYPTTPETYLGYLRGKIANPRTYFHKEESHLFNDAGEYRLHQWYLEGEWRIYKEYVEHTRTTKNTIDYIALCFSATEVNIVMESEEPAQVEFLWDGMKPWASAERKGLDEGIRGKDVRESEGHTVVEISGARMYNILSSREMLEGVLYIAVRNKGVRAYAFTFGGCVGA